MSNKLINWGFFLVNLGLLALLLSPGVIAAKGKGPQAGLPLPPAPKVTPHLDQPPPAAAEAPEQKQPAAPALGKAVPGGCAGVETYRRLPTADPVVALTFDDGPGKLTKKLVEILAEKNVPATFFLVGQAALANPELVKVILDGGCQVALHTWSHPCLTKLQKEKIYWQIEAGAAVFAAMEADYLPLLRPPYGCLDERVRGVCQRLGCHLVLWDVDSRDWEGEAPDKMLAQVLKNLKAGSIVLFHEGKKNALAMLPEFIDAVRAKGYEFVLLSDYLPLPQEQGMTGSLENTESRSMTMGRFYNGRSAGSSLPAPLPGLPSAPLGETGLMPSLPGQD